MDHLIDMFLESIQCHLIMDKTQASFQCCLCWFVLEQPNVAAVYFYSPVPVLSVLGIKPLVIASELLHCMYRMLDVKFL